MSLKWNDCQANVKPDFALGFTISAFPFLLLPSPSHPSITSTQLPLMCVTGRLEVWAPEAQACCKGLVKNNPRSSFRAHTGLHFCVVVFLVFKGKFFTDAVRVELDKQNKCYFKHHNDNNLIKCDLLLITLLAFSFWKVAMWIVCFCIFNKGGNKWSCL